MPIGGYHTYNLILSGALSAGSSVASNNAAGGTGNQGGNPSRDPPTGPRKGPIEYAPPQPGPDEWIDAGRGYRIGDAMVKVLSAQVEPLRSKDGKEVSKDKALLLRVEIRNISDKEVDYFGWGYKEPRPDEAWPTLTDNNGVAYKRATLESGAVLANQSQGETIMPGKSTVDVLAFDLPKDDLTYLRLELAGSYLGASGKVKLQLPKAILGRGGDSPKKDPGPGPDPIVRPGQKADQAKQFLAQLNKATGPQERLAAVNGLVECGGDAIIAGAELAALLDPKKEGNEQVRAAAAEALGAIGRPARLYTAPLTNALIDEFWKVQANAARALGQIGLPEATIAIPRLMKLVNSKDEEAAKAAREALRRIDPRNPLLMPKK
jgi:hypothetical protein